MWTSQEVAIIESKLKTDPEFLLLAALQNNPEDASQMLGMNYGIVLNNEEVQSILDGMAQIMEAQPNEAANIVKTALSIPILPSRLTDPARAAIFGNVELGNMANMGPFSGDYGLNDSDLNQLGSGNSSADSWDWAEIATGLIPGILTLFGIDAPQNGGTNNNDQLQQLILQQQEAARKQQQMLLWIGGFILLIILVFVIIKAVKK